MIDESCIVLEPGFKRLNEMGPLDDDVAIVLASEMVKFAMQDLTMASRKLRYHPYMKKERRVAFQKLLKDAEDFFRSKWFAMIVDHDACDPEKLIKFLRSA